MCNIQFNNCYVLNKISSNDNTKQIVEGGQYRVLIQSFQNNHNNKNCIYKTTRNRVKRFSTLIKT